MSDAIDIREPLREICDRLGLKYDTVARLNFEPSRIRADVYLEDADGKTWIDPTTNEAAMEWRDFKVTT